MRLQSARRNLRTEKGCRVCLTVDVSVHWGKLRISMSSQHVPVLSQHGLRYMPVMHAMQPVAPKLYTTGSVLQLNNITDPTDCLVDADAYHHGAAIAVAVAACAFLLILIAGWGFWYRRSRRRSVGLTFDCHAHHWSDVNCMLAQVLCHHFF